MTTSCALRARQLYIHITPDVIYKYYERKQVRTDVIVYNLVTIGNCDVLV